MTRIAVGGAGPTGVKWPNYVNGRLLFAQDLATDDDAVRRRDGWLGRAIGPGVAEGLEASGSPGSSTLFVPPGTGVSLGGTAAHLDAPATLDLAVVSAAPPGDDAVFGDCTPASTEAKAPVAGSYLLVMRAGPGSYADKVPVAGAPTTTLPTPCTARWQVEDVVFAAIRLDGFTDDTTDDDRRNLLAHWCFGSAALDDLALSGFTAPVPYSGLAALADLDGCDLPLAVFDWDGAALRFVDRWSARRRPMRPSAAAGGLAGSLSTVLDDTRTAEGEARFLQFQEQLFGLVATAAGKSVRAQDVFPLLPPAGLVPIAPFATAAHLAKLGDFKPSKPAVPAVTAHAVVSSKLIEEFVGGTGAFVNIGGVTTAPLGAVSQKLRELEQQIAALTAKVDALQAAAESDGDGGDTPAGPEVFGRQLAAAVAGVLVDTAGDGVDPGQFFDGVQLRIGVVDHETVDFTIRRSWYDEPIDLRTDPTVNVYFVTSADGEQIAPYLLFTKKLRGVRWISKSALIFG
jgi:hypothetical protein